MLVGIRQISSHGTDLSAIATFIQIYKTMTNENIGADVLVDGERSRWDCRRCSHGCRLLDSHEEEDVLQVAGDDGRSQDSHSCM